MAVRRITDGTDPDGEVVYETHKHTPLQLVRSTERRIGATFTGTTQALAIPSGAIVVELTASENCYINFGGSGQTATSTIATDGSRLFLAGVQVIIVPMNGAVPFTHIAVIQQSTSGILQIEEVE